MSDIIKIVFGNYTYIENNSDGIDTDRYIINFSLINIKEPPYADEVTKHKIKVIISGTILATSKYWNCTKSDIPKIVFVHACEYIKALILDNKIQDNYELILDKRRLKQYKLDVNKIPNIENFECIIDTSQRKKFFGFRQ